MDPLAVFALAIAALLGGVVVAARGAMTVLVAEVRDGKMEVTRGGIAPRLLADLADIVARPPVTRATVRVTRAGGRAQVVVQGDLTPAQVQQVRNVIGSVPLAKLVNARRRR
jgi:hypothetical protein